MKKLIQDIKSGFVIWVVFLLVVISGWIVYAWVWLTASSWDTLTHTKWNELLYQTEISNSIQSLPRIIFTNWAWTATATNITPSVNCVVWWTNWTDCSLWQDTQGRSYKLISWWWYCNWGYALRESTIYNGAFRITCHNLSVDDYRNGAWVDLVVKRTN